MANELEIDSLFGAQDTSNIVDTLDFGNNKKYHIHDKQLWDVSYNIAYKVNEVIDEVANIDTTGVNLSEYVDNATAELTYAQNPNTDEVAVLSSVKLNLGGSKDKYLEVLTSYKCPTSAAFNEFKGHFVDISYEDNNDPNGIYALKEIDFTGSTYTSGDFAYVASYDFVDDIRNDLESLTTNVNDITTYINGFFDDTYIGSNEEDNGDGIHIIKDISFTYNPDNHDGTSGHYGVSGSYAYVASYDFAWSNVEILTAYVNELTTNVSNLMDADITSPDLSDSGGVYALSAINFSNLDEHDSSSTYITYDFTYLASYDFADGIRSDLESLTTNVDDITTYINNLMDVDITSPDLSEGGGVYALSAINFSNLDGDDSNSAYITYDFTYLASYDFAWNTYSNVEILTGYINTLTTNVNNINSYLNEHSFITASYLEENGYITASYLEENGYITSQYLEDYGYITASYLEENDYITSQYLEDYGYITASYLEENDYITASYVTENVNDLKSYINEHYVTQHDLENAGYITAADLENYVTEDEIPDLSAIENIADLPSYINGFFGGTYIGSTEADTVNGIYVTKDITFTYTEGNQYPYGATGNFAYVATYNFVDSIKDNADYAYSYVNVWANISAEGSYTGVTNDNDPNTTAVVSGVSLDLTYTASLENRITLRSTNVASTYAFNSLTYRIDDIEEHTYAFVDNTSNNYFTTTEIKNYTIEYNSTSETLNISYTLVNPYTGVNDLPVTIIYGYGETVNDSTAPNNIEAE